MQPVLVYLGTTSGITDSNINNSVTSGITDANNVNFNGATSGIIYIWTITTGMNSVEKGNEAGRNEHAVVLSKKTSNILEPKGKTWQKCCYR